MWLNTQFDVMGHKCSVNSFFNIVSKIDNFDNSSQKLNQFSLPLYFDDLVVCSLFVFLQLEKQVGRLPKVWLKLSLSLACRVLRNKLALQWMISKGPDRYVSHLCIHSKCQIWGEENFAIYYMMTVIMQHIGLHDNVHLVSLIYN
jgi:hypothetical protein